VVPQPERAPDRCRNHARSAADVKHRALLVGYGRDDPTVASYPPERFRGNVGSIIQGRRQCLFRRSQLAIEVHDDLMSVSRYPVCAIATTGQVRRKHVNQTIGGRGTRRLGGARFGLLYRRA
jgi:hypothetical protein